MTGDTRQHPTYGVLALLAGKDLPLVQRLRIGRHLAVCSQCRAQLESIRSARSELRREAEAETLTSFEAIADWSRLEREMMGNIAVGVSAARCIDHVHKSRRYILPSAVSAVLLMVFALGWATHIPGEQTHHLVSSITGWWSGDSRQPVGTILRTSPRGVAVRSQGTTLTLMHPASATVTMSGASAVEARFIDESTGQVTITSVYGQ